MDKEFKILQWKIQHRVGLPNKNPIQVKDIIMNELYLQFNLTYSFNYNNFKIHINNVYIHIKHSIRSSIRESVIHKQWREKHDNRRYTT